MASREASQDNQPIYYGWLGHGAVPLAQRDIVKRGDCAVVTAAVPSPPVVPGAADRPNAIDVLPLSGREAGLDVATMQERYPLLRNAL